jgi:hypothetical protein
MGAECEIRGQLHAPAVLIPAPVVMKLQVCMDLVARNKVAVVKFVVTAPHGTNLMLVA